MSKVIAVIDNPKSCLSCQFGRSVLCSAMFNQMTEPNMMDAYQKFKIYDNKFNHTKPSWCPLKEVPEKGENDHEDMWADGFQSGWNHCIDEIMGSDET